MHVASDVQAKSEGTAKSAREWLLQLCEAVLVETNLKLHVLFVIYIK